MILLAILRLGDDVYGFLVQRTIECAGREGSVESVYAALGRLELNGLVASRPGESASVRAGRAKRFLRDPARSRLCPGSLPGSRRELWSELPYFREELA